MVLAKCDKCVKVAGVSACVCNSHRERRVVCVALSMAPHVTSQIFPFSPDLTSVMSRRLLRARWYRESNACHLSLS